MIGQWCLEQDRTVDATSSTTPLSPSCGYRVRQFLRVREVAARTAGVEPQQYLLLLQLKGLEGHGPVTIGVLAERLQVRHHTVVELVDPSDSVAPWASWGPAGAPPSWRCSYRWRTSYWCRGSSSSE